MVHYDEYAPPSETRIIAAGDQTARIKRGLGEARRSLARTEPSTTTQRLKLSLDAFDRIVDSWSTQPPTGAQLALIQEHLDEVLQLTKRSTPTVRLPVVKIRRSACRSR
jgi:hypothetical protein